MALTVAIIGATGAVGETLVALLAERRFPLTHLIPVASEASVGEVIQLGQKSYPTTTLDQVDFQDVDIAFFTANPEISAQYAEQVVRAGCLVIDNTSAFRESAHVPLVIPEINGSQLTEECSGRLIASPNCATIQMLMALYPIYQKVGITRINVATYQSVAGQGKAGVEELATQVRCLLNGQTATPDVFSKRIAFNVLPCIDVLQENGYTKEEMKMHLESRKILSDETLAVNATAVRVPVFYGHALAIHLETKKPFVMADILSAYQDMSGVTLAENPTPADLLTADNRVLVGRLRQDISHPQGLNLWCVADSLRKGAALNCIQIAEQALVAEFI